MGEEEKGILKEAQRRLYYNLPSIIQLFAEAKAETNPQMQISRLELLLDMTLLISKHRKEKNISRNAKIY
ncbi:hypothetical protein M2451_002919 [Dysgonomonas sp. PFB1-18]|uniref:hypothetical protein n=1 Tax=unclassified Dysgonomonas TaxID=2630389 RepID=UPI0013D6EA28|nr:MULTISPECIES: hypothetical protein [unclassified Dysgonomonas]MDH6310029.1 hypothetical protein [Dysgonomonas sp. PF1-14]MDH6339938.1 hypothetical protein [Dysgonomonas sp. PF1-16]MDH6381586.1 hypothetical protein [Dysgonomonas sp. PFB1-18]MDH6398777.1 hypothetical protein [Dysgonomonas sp. PF1-23]NDV93622.1 hypothetical protein [Dysgonomonas sp. 521]